MLDTKLEENNAEKNNLKRAINAIDGENNKVSYLANQKDNEDKLEFLKNTTYFIQQQHISILFLINYQKIITWKLMKRLKQ